MAIVTDVITRARRAGGVPRVSAEKKRGKKRPEHTPLAGTAAATAHTGTGSSRSQVDAAMPSTAHAAVEPPTVRARVEISPPTTDPPPNEASSQPATVAPPPCNANRGMVA